MDEAAAPAGPVGTPIAPSAVRPATQPVLIPLCRKGDRAGIEQKLQAGASIEETDIEGNTPLHVAVEAPKNEIATVQCLLENGANANATNFLGASPLHYVCLRKSNQRGMANMLLENGAQINSQTLAGKTALHFACESQLPELVEVLCLFGAETNAVDSERNSPIHLTVSKGAGRDTVKRQILEMLMTYQAGFAAANAAGFTPLHLACQSGSIRCAQCLLDRRADVQAIAAHAGLTCLHLACAGGHAEMTQLILQVSPQSLDMVDAEGNTALHKCAAVGNLDSALSLLKLGANTTIKNSQNKTVEDVAKMKGNDMNNMHNPELLQVLQETKKDGSCRQQ